MTDNRDDYIVGYTFEDIKRMADDVLTRTPIRPSVGIICGTGLGDLVETVKDATVIPYDTIPEFPVCTVKGHQGKLVLGKIGDKSVCMMVGRFHFYEGYPMWKVAMPVRMMKEMGIETLVATNAAGSLNPEYKLGDIMVFRDHLDLPGLTAMNVLRGKNDERFGPRFLATNSIYDEELRQKFKEVAANMGISDEVHEGVYFMEIGPTFLTIPEAKLIRMIGADAAGMSTIPETVAAKHCGMRVFAFSLITDIEELEDDKKVELSHQEVLEYAQKRSPVLQKLVQEFVLTI